MFLFDDGLGLLLVALGLLVIGGPVVAIVALVRTYNLQSEIDSLRGQIAALLRRPAQAAAERRAETEATPALTDADGVPPGKEPAGTEKLWDGVEPAEKAAPAEIRAETPAAKPDLSLEQVLGARAFAWVGALAIALAGVFLVKYSIDQGYLDPTARVALAGALGAVLIGVGEWLRGRDARIAQALAAAGVAVLFSALFAAVALYDLVPRAIAGVLAAALTALAIALSLRHGPFVALLGLVGGSIAPAIIGEQTFSAQILFAYLLLLVGGVLVVVRHRQWWWLGWCALVSAAGWAAFWMDAAYRAEDAHWLGLYLLAIVGLYVWVAWRSLSAPQPLIGLAEFMAVHARGVQPLVWAAAAAMMALQAVLLARTGYVSLHWVFYIAAGLSLFALGRQIPTLQFLAVGPVVLSAFLFLSWADDFKFFRPEGVSARGIALAALAVGGTFAAAAYALLWNARRPGFWAALCAGGAFVHFVAVCAGLYRFDIGIAWGYASLALAVPLLVVSERVAAWRLRLAGSDEALGMLAVGATFFISAAVPLELRREWVTMAYAIELPAVAWIAWRLNLPILRWLAWALTATVTIRLVFNPYVLDYDVSSNPLLNWVLYGYGVPIVCYWIAARFLRRVRDDELVMAIEASILAFAFLLLTLQVRSIFNPDGLGQERFGVAERAWMAVSWGALALGLAYGAWRRPHPVLVWGWRLVGLAAISLAFFGSAIWFDALFEDGTLGRTALFNGLIVCFLLPALLAAGATWMLQRMDERAGALVAGVAALVFGFAFLGYEVRHYFAFAEGRTAGPIGDAELYAYSIVWLVYGTGLLVAGILTRQAMLRYASLAMLVLVVGKVFLIDMADLTGLLRVASFLGLGVALLALGFLYRRYVFRDDARAADSGGGPG